MSVAALQTTTTYKVTETQLCDMNSGEAKGADAASDNAIDITPSQHTTPLANGGFDNGNLLAGLNVPIDGTDAQGNIEGFLAQLQDRIEDTKDALMESEPFAQFVDTSSKALSVGGSILAFSKKAAWILGTSALLLVVPLLYEMDKEMNAGQLPDGTVPSGPPAANSGSTGDSGSGEPS